MTDGPARGGASAMGAAFALAAAVAALGLGGCGPRTQHRPARLSPAGRGRAPAGMVAGASLVICVIDAARADHVGCYGYARATTPNLDRIGEESCVFLNHFTQATWTKLSTASLFASQYGDTHMAFGDRPLPESAFTMARGLGAAGLRTALFSANVQAAPPYGIGTDYDDVCWLPELQPLLRPGEAVHSPEVLLRAFTGWLAEHRTSRFFAYIHFVPPHWPYHPPDEMVELFGGDTPPGYGPGKHHPGEYEFPVQASVIRTPPPLPQWINLYDANLRYADRAVGQVRDALVRFGLLDKTLLVVTSDHGEAFGEHGFTWHAEAIHDEASRIPLLIRLPGGTHHREIRALTQAIDLLPTVFDLLGVPYPADRVQGRSLLPLITGRSHRVHDFVYTRAIGQADDDKYMVRGERYALLLYSNGKWRALYDLASDPEQRHNVIGELPDVAEELEEVFREFAGRQTASLACFLDPNAALSRHRRERETTLAPEVERELRALGYLE